MINRTKSTAMIEAKKYTTRQEMNKKANSLYQFLWKNGILDEACSHMSSGRFSYSDDDVLNNAKQYNSKKEWNEKDSAMYRVASNKGKDFFSQCCSHMKELMHYWSKDEILREARKYEFACDFNKLSPNAAAAARRMKITQDVYKNLKYKKQRYNNEEIIEIAKKYKKKIDFSSNNKGAYAYSVRNEELHKKACAHMKSEGINFNKKGFLYYVSIDNGLYYKIGITSRNIKKRFAGDIKRVRLIFIKEFDTLRNAKEEEQKIIKKYKKYQVDNKVLQVGNTEIFTFDILGLDITLKDFDTEL